MGNTNGKGSYIVNGKPKLTFELSRVGKSLLFEGRHKTADPHTDFIFMLQAMFDDIDNFEIIGLTMTFPTLPKFEAEFGRSKPVRRDRGNSFLGRWEQVMSDTKGKRPNAFRRWKNRTGRKRVRSNSGAREVS